MRDPKSYSKDELDNYSNQLNENNDAFWQSRGFDERPEDWDQDDGLSSDDDAFDSYMSDSD